MADSDAPVVAFDKEAAYKQSQEQCRSFFEKYDVDRTGRMATINAVLKLNFPSFWFVGFYTVKPDAGAPDLAVLDRRHFLCIAEEVLQIGAYQGLLIASGIIPFGKGVCGTCAKEQKTQIVGNVCSITVSVLLSSATAGAHVPFRTTSHAMRTPSPKSSSLCTTLAHPN